MLNVLWVEQPSWLFLSLLVIGYISMPRLIPKTVLIGKQALSLAVQKRNGDDYDDDKTDTALRYKKELNCLGSNPYLFLFIQ